MLNTTSTNILQKNNPPMENKLWSQIFSEDKRTQQRASNGFGSQHLRHMHSYSSESLRSLGVNHNELLRWLKEFSAVDRAVFLSHALLTRPLQDSTLFPYSGNWAGPCGCAPIRPKHSFLDPATLGRYEENTHRGVLALAQLVSSGQHI